MSRDKISVTITPRITQANDIELTMVHRIGDLVTKHEAMVMQMSDNAVRHALMVLGWTPPPRAGETFDPHHIDKQLHEIGGDGPTAPMLSYQGEGRILVGGVVSTQQLVALAALSARCVQ